MGIHSQPRPLSGEFSPRSGLFAVIVGDTSAIASSVVDSLPDEMPFFLVGPQSIAFLQHSIRCQAYVPNDLSLGDSSKTEFVRTIECLRRTSPEIVLIPVDDAANRIVYATFDHLKARSYPRPDSDCFELLNDKWEFYRLCTKLGVRVPRTIRLNQEDDVDFDRLRTALGLPFVLKPTNKSNSIGYQIIGSSRDFADKILSAGRYAFYPAIAQSFIPGIDIDISALADRGRITNCAIQIRKKDELLFVRNEELNRFAEVVVRGIRLSGVVHIDARLHDRSNEIFLIEANPRFWGSLSEATAGGLNFVRAGLCAVLGTEGADPSVIFDVSVPSARRILVESLTFKRSYRRWDRLERLRVQRWMRNSVRRALHLDL